MGKAKVPKMSTMRADGGGFKERMEERRSGRDSSMVRPIRASSVGSGPSLAKTSTGGSITMLREGMVDV